MFYQRLLINLANVKDNILKTQQKLKEKKQLVLKYDKVWNKKDYILVS